MRAALLIALLGSGLAFGAPGADKLMAQGEFERALAALNGQLSRKPPPRAAAALHLKRAHCYFALQQSGRAKEALKSALKLDAEAFLDPAHASPLLVELLEQARAGVLGELAVTSDLEGGEVRIDGRSVGPPPLKAPVSVGRRKVELVTRDGAVRTREAVARFNATSKVHFEAQSAPDVAAPSLPPLPEVSAAAPPSSEPAPPPPEVSAAPEAPPTARPFAPAPAVTAAKAPYRSKAAGGVLLAGGGVLLAGGAVGIIHSVGVKQAFDRQQQPGEPLTVTRDQANLAQTLFPVSVGAAAAGAALATVGLVVLTRPDRPALALVPLPEGGLLASAAARF